MVHERETLRMLNDGNHHMLWIFKQEEGQENMA